MHPLVDESSRMVYRVLPVPEAHDNAKMCSESKKIRSAYPLHSPSKQTLPTQHNSSYGNLLEETKLKDHHNTENPLKILFMGGRNQRRKFSKQLILRTHSVTYLGRCSLS